MQNNETRNVKRTPTAADYLGGESPRARGEKKRRKVLEWVYRWGYSSAEILREVAGQQAKGYAKGLSEKGWLVEKKTESRLPRCIYTLSQIGQQDAERRAEKLLRYPEADSSKVKQQQIHHYLLAQRATINALVADTIIGYETERMIDEEGDKAGEKRPDVIWLLPDGKKMGVEIELSPKWDHNFYLFVLGIVRALSPTSTGQPAKYQSFAIVTESSAIYSRYKRDMQPGADLQIFKKNDRQHWEKAGCDKVPNWLDDKVTFVLLDH
ncbi:hypothetical protein [Propionivibrio dicarboxylicus]|uniref:Replication-relaxation n=1 Tax=Propionivibrio dicarboxylicus TaxID=83767 RepID=A0A1G8EM39_9RHOO|nr:hypothetical protein [Propionivibrio dicarboxylicus]SDH70937.1 hypothetical protein SAMN05660652_02126 [Propionivibrio dicarboxylicus]